MVVTTGAAVGVMLGAADGDPVTGAAEGARVVDGESDGTRLGEGLGTRLGVAEGTALGTMLGTMDGEFNGDKVGVAEGDSDGMTEGCLVGENVGGKYSTLTVLAVWSTIYTLFEWSPVIPTGSLRVALVAYPPSPETLLAPVPAIT